MGFSRLQPTYSFLAIEDTQHHDDEHITETGNGNHNGIVIKMYIAIATYCARCNLH